MKITRILFAGLVLCIAAACSDTSITEPDAKEPVRSSSCGYLGSAGCP